MTLRIFFLRLAAIISDNLDEHDNTSVLIQQKYLHVSHEQALALEC